MPKRITLEAPAKLNLFLEVLGKRTDGYHEIRTVMHPVSLSDRITFSVNGRGVGVEGDTAELGADNLIVRAAGLLSDRVGRRLGVRAVVRKRIPAGGGLGGGSSNAAATLVAMNRLHGLDLPWTELQVVAARIGSDVPFFIGPDGPRTALCTGRGERVTALLTHPMHFVVVNPGIAISTPAVYKALNLALTPQNKDAIQFVKTWSTGAVKKIGGALFNRLEKAAFGLAPELRKLKKKVAAMDTQGVLMSGSGSTVFALCRDASQARNLAKRLARLDLPCVRAVRSADGFGRE